MGLPKSFVDLDRAYKSPAETFINIIGVVVDIMPPTITTKAQHMFTFKLLDPQLHNSVYGHEGLRVRFFKGDPRSLPKVQQIGDVVLLRNAKITSFQQQPVVLSNWQVETTVFPAASIPDTNFEIAYQGKQRLERLGVPLDVEKVSLDEQSYVIQLKHDIREILPFFLQKGNSGLNAINTAPAPALSHDPTALGKRPGHELNIPEPKRQRSGQKLKMIKELNHYDFADIFAQVVKKFPTNMGTCDLYVTDYTENKQMFLYSAPEEEDDREREGDTFGYTDLPKRSWPGPYGQLVLRIELRDPHAHYANRQVKEGDFVLLKNVKIKVFRHLEGSMWPDDRNPEEAKISKIKNLESSEVQVIRERKERYWAARESKTSRSEQPVAKKQTVSERKKEKKRREAEKAAAANKTETLNAGGAALALQNCALNGHRKTNVNQHVRCSHEYVPTSSIKTIRDMANEMHTVAKSDQPAYVMPFINVKRRAHVRVVDYEPRQLEDFALPEGLDDDKSDDSQAIDYESSPKYEWFFSLQLEDVSKPKLARSEEDRIWVNVMHTEAQYLFGNDMDDPRDLRSDLLLLSKMREKLCILWGNLEEKSNDEELSNRPFECCLAEYAVAMDEDDPERSNHSFGFKRMYSMFGVTIL